MFKKILIVLLSFLILLFSGCGKKPEKKKSENKSQGNTVSSVKIEKKKYSKPEKAEETLSVPENVFVMQVDDIYNNFEDYSNKNIEIEGMFGYYFGPDGEQNIPAVYRRSPGCCGSDGITGFALEIPEGIEIPKENEWIKVLGRPIKTNNNGMPSVNLRVISIEKPETRGLEFVSK